MRVGLISDTHDLLREEAVAALDGVDRIVHCGDVCRPEILTELGAVAPLDVVRGNCDYGDWTQDVPWSDTLELDGVLVYVRHIVTDIDLDPAAATISLVLFGHTHQPALEVRDGVTYFNPGSAGPRRFDYPVTIGMLRTGDDAGAVGDVGEHGFHLEHRHLL